MKISLLIPLILLMTLGGFKKIQVGDDHPQINGPSELQGSWHLVSFKYGEDKEYSQVPEFVKYVKHITKRHFSWASYNEDGDVVGAGGGTYRIEDNQYFEVIDFFHPPGTNLAGTSVTYDFTVDGNKWTISGYIKAVNLDPNSAEWKQIDSTKLEEVWMRIM